MSETITQPAAETNAADINSDGKKARGLSALIDIEGLLWLDLDDPMSSALDDLAGRERACRGGRPAVELGQKTILLVDCGIRSEK